MRFPAKEWLVLQTFVDTMKQQIPSTLLIIFAFGFSIFFATLTTAFISGPGGPCSNCPRGWWCCGKEDQCFNPRTFMCCNDNVTATCGPQSRCCGEQCYDLLEDVCCNGVVSKKCSENFWCCGTRCYSPDEHHCCDGEIFTCPPNHICCERGCYDPLIQLCCNRNIVEKCSQDETGRCCGDRCYNTETERCDFDRKQWIIRARFFERVVFNN